MALSELAKALLWGVALVVIVAVVAGGIAIVIAVTNKSPPPTTDSDSPAGAGAPGDMVREAPVPKLPGLQGPTVKGASVRIVPRDTLLKVEYWSDDWRFAQPDIGHVSFVVNKRNGLVVTLADAPGYPKGGYAFVIDQRGGQTTNFADTTTSATFLTRLPQFEQPASNSALVRNIELDNVPRRIDISYRHGIIELYVDGVLCIGYNDPFPNSNISYVGFGTMGVKSGEGMITDLVIE